MRVVQVATSVPAVSSAKAPMVITGDAWPAARRINASIVSQSDAVCAIPTDGLMCAKTPPESNG